MGGTDPSDLDYVLIYFHGTFFYLKSLGSLIDLAYASSRPWNEVNWKIAEAETSGQLPVANVSFASLHFLAEYYSPPLDRYKRS